MENGRNAAPTSVPTGVSVALRHNIGTGKEGFALDVAFTCPARGITVLFGPSGCGKTTLLRCLAGLEVADHGRISVNGMTWEDGTVRLPSHRRGLAYVFQEASLFPHLNVAGNLDFARKRAIHPYPEREWRRLIELMGIPPLLSRAVAQLSGGERQRVAIARALAANPRLLLMDEPLAALDGPRKAEILPFLEALHEELQIPVLYVTHSVEEAARLADHVLLMDAGRLVASGPVGEVFPAPRFAPYFGAEAGAIIEARVEEIDSRWQLARLRFEGGELWVRDNGKAPGSRVRLRILARDVSLSLEARQPSSILNRLPARVLTRSDADDEAMTLLGLELGEATLLASISRRSAHELQLQEGSQVWAQIKSVAILR